MCDHTEKPERVKTEHFDVEVDRCIANLVRALNTNGIRTATSCCGHGEHDGFIKVIENGEERLLIVCQPGKESRSRYFSDFEPMARKFDDERKQGAATDGTLQAGASTFPLPE